MIDEKMHETVKRLIADEFIAWQQYYLMNTATGSVSNNPLKDLFLEIAEDELEDHYLKLVRWCQMNGLDVPVTLSSIKESANDGFFKVEYADSLFNYIRIAVKSEDGAIKAYDEAIKLAHQLQYPDLEGILKSIYDDEVEHLEKLLAKSGELKAYISDDGKSKVPVKQLIGLKNAPVQSNTSEVVPDVNIQQR